MANQANPMLNDVTFLYCNIQKPTKKYESDATEWSVQCAISKAAAKAWNKQFSKQKAKEIDNDEWEDKYKCAIPFPEQDEQYVIKLAKATHYKDGNPCPYQPKVFEAINGGKVLKNITNTKLVANGSKGRVEYRILENSFGTFASLNQICVDELIEYISQDSNPFGGTIIEDEEGEGFVDKEAKDLVKEAPKANGNAPIKAKPKAKVEEPLDDDMDDDIPF